MSWENTSRMQSLFSKRNLLPGIASEKLIKTTKGFQLKEDTTWSYQIQGYYNGYNRNSLYRSCDLHKQGILIVPVEFNEQFWHQILDKHTCFLLYSWCLSFFLESFCVVSILRWMVFAEIRVYVVGEIKISVKIILAKFPIISLCFWLYDNEIWRKGNAKTNLVEMIWVWPSLQSAIKIFAL